MSYEGFSQFLCKKGHYWTTDCSVSVSIECEKCPVCLNPAVWENMVDETNGNFDVDGKTRIDGYIKLKLREKRTCRHCKSVLEIRYVIPSKGSSVRWKKMKKESK